MSQLVRLEGKHTTQSAHCALVEQSHSYNVHPFFMFTLSNTVSVTKKDKFNNVAQKA